MRKDGSVTIFAEEYTVSYGGYLLEEASYHCFDCAYDMRFAFKLHVQNSRLDPKISALGKSPSYAQ